MRGVECGPERRPVISESLYQLAREEWAFLCDGIEFVVGGRRGPDPGRLGMAERVAARLDAFAAEADEYLAGFVDAERLGGRRPWQIESLVFGAQRSDAVDEFEVILVLEGDTYGVWGVRFRPGRSPSDRFYPIEFRRRQR